MKNIFITLLLLLFCLSLTGQDPILFEEGSIKVSIGSNLKKASTNKHVTLNFKGEENPQFYIAFEDLQWKKNNDQRIYQLIVNTDWITIKGDNHTIKKSNKEIKLIRSNKRKIVAIYPPPILK